MEDRIMKVLVDLDSKDNFRKSHPVCFEVPGTGQKLNFTVNEARFLAEELTTAAKDAENVREMENTLSTVCGYAQDIVDEVNKYFDSHPSERNPDGVLHDIVEHFEYLKDLLE